MVRRAVEAGRLTLRGLARIEEQFRRIARGGTVGARPWRAGAAGALRGGASADARGLAGGKIGGDKGDHDDKDQATEHAEA